MWLIANYFVDILLIVGVISVIFSCFILDNLSILLSKLSIILVKVVSISILLVGVYFKGGISVEEKWKSKVSELEEKLKIAEEKSKVTNEKIVIEYRDRVKVVTDTKIVVEEKIKEVEKIIDSKCELSPEVIDLHNASAKTPEKK